jgi:hypothetical protein
MNIVWWAGPAITGLLLEFEDWWRLLAEPFFPKKTKKYKRPKEKRSFFGEKFGEF